MGLRCVLVGFLDLGRPIDIKKVCRGREYVLKEFQRLIFRAGANGTMIGNYLTTAGNSPEEDHRMIAEVGMRVL